jgi:uroporphyrinogen-III decarboxylase
VPILKSVKDIEKLKVPDPSDHPKVNWVWEEAEKVRKILKKRKVNLPFRGAHFQIHPPLSTACAIMNPADVYTLMYTEPKAVFLLFDKLFEAFCKLVDYSDRRNGIKKRDSIALADDNSAFISAKMYRRFVLPYNKRIYERYGQKTRFLHADGPNDHLFSILANEIGLTAMDIGGFSSLEAAVKAMKGKVVIQGGLNNKDLYQGLTEKVKEKIRKAIKLAAPGGGYEFAIGGETYVGITPETLIDLVNYVKKIGKYPIQ